MPTSAQLQLVVSRVVPPLQCRCKWPCLHLLRFVVCLLDGLLYTILQFDKGESGDEASDICMQSQDRSVTTNTLYAKAQELANAGKIDPISNLSSRRAYVQAGASYEAVYQSAGETATSLFSRFGYNVLSKFDLDTGHGIPTLDYGQPCNR